MHPGRTWRDRQPVHSPNPTPKIYNWLQGGCCGDIVLTWRAARAAESPGGARLVTQASAPAGWGLEWRWDLPGMLDSPPGCPTVTPRASLCTQEAPHPRSSKRPRGRFLSPWMSSGAGWWLWNLLLSAIPPQRKSPREPWQLRLSPLQRGGSRGGPRAPRRRRSCWSSSRSPEPGPCARNGEAGWAQAQRQDQWWTRQDRQHLRCSSHPSRSGTPSQLCQPRAAPAPPLLRSCLHWPDYDAHITVHPIPTNTRYWQGPVSASHPPQ
ncbi:uncharacterized protein LOC119256289 isoform X3 [Talpa occidentalis]|uniref:uncharacterized protein LOC119256289 isoform X3 n=1 Tax=Talpa occidentalis TaxID=50954 RepID=UPI0023F7DD26|nr:uncharacterized protein LOC119256289 isoform X3 [Talpa occidentalis]